MNPFQIAKERARAEQYEDKILFRALGLDGQTLRVCNFPLTAVQEFFIGTTKYEPLHWQEYYQYKLFFYEHKRLITRIRTKHMEMVVNSFRLHNLYGPAFIRGSERWFFINNHQLPEKELIEVIQRSREAKLARVLKKETTD